MPKNEGGPERVRSSDVTAPEPEPPTLAQIGITKNQSSAWQRIADIPADDFEGHIEETKAARERPITGAAPPASLRRLWRDSGPPGGRAEAAATARGAGLVGRSYAIPATDGAPGLGNPTDVPAARAA
jgi:hypothetical protein